MESITVTSARLRGVEAELVEIRIHRSPRPTLEIEGLPEAAARELRVRVRSALTECGVSIEGTGGARVVFPEGEHRGSQGYDLAVAMGILCLREGRLAPGLVVGELSLSGEIRPVRGVVAMLEAAHAAGLPWAMVPRASAREASYGPPGLRMFFASHLAEKIGPLDVENAQRIETGLPPLDQGAYVADLADVAGMEAGRAALEAAVATGQNLLLLGAPGSGKTMLARRAGSLMPDPTEDERRLLARIQSAAGLPVTGARPFRAPHHTASTTAIVGGGEPVRPGEMTLAHHGVLFLDELPEMTRASVDALKHAVVRGQITIPSRRGSVVTMPAKPLIVGAMNLCPCGYRGNGADTRTNRGCTCSPKLVQSYFDRVVGPLREVFPLAVVLDTVRVGEIAKSPAGESSATVRARIASYKDLPWHHPALAFETVMQLARPS